MNKNIIAMLPFLDDEDLNDLVHKIIESETGEFKGLRLESIAPFVDDKVWPEVVESCLKGNKKINLVPLYPFLDDDTLGVLFAKANEGTAEGVNVLTLLPFVDEKSIDAAFAEHVKSGKDYQSFLPFVSEKSLHQMAVDYANDALTDIDIDLVFPFMEDQDIKLIFRHALEKKDPEENQ
jgi:hypothetical protein